MRQPEGGLVSVNHVRMTTTLQLTTPLAPHTGCIAYMNKIEERKKGRNKHSNKNNIQANETKGQHSPQTPLLGLVANTAARNISSASSRPFDAIISLYGGYVSHSRAMNASTWDSSTSETVHPPQPAPVYRQRVGCPVGSEE